MFVICCVIRHILATDIAREVEGGVQLLKTGSIQLIVPDILSFTIKKDASCQGDLEICYVYDPSVRAKIRTYINVGTMCPPDSCTLLMTHSGSAFGLGSEQHNGNFYGILVEGSSVSCPRYIVDGRSNFTILELPTCPVIVEGAMLPKNEKTKPKTANSIVWIIPVCVGLFLLYCYYWFLFLYAIKETAGRTTNTSQKVFWQQSISAKYCHLGIAENTYVKKYSISRRQREEQ
uniref:ZP domain-containing protein n=1 Tax=Panagrellus redivivus TaxID=6233 RepID=A0A7E5A0V0_PANRE